MTNKNNSRKLSLGKKDGSKLSDLFCYFKYSIEDSYICLQKLGVLSLIDEESRFPKGTDDSMLVKLHSSHEVGEILPISVYLLVSSSCQCFTRPERFGL